MNKSVFTVLFLMLLGIPVSVSANSNYLKMNGTPYITSSGANPNSKGVRSATYYFDLYSSEKLLTKVTITIPKNLKVNGGIDVTNGENREVGASLKFEENKAVINFAQPIPTNTTLKFYMHSVSIQGVSQHIWIFPLSTTSVGINADIPIESVRIQTRQ